MVNLTDFSRGNPIVNLFPYPIKWLIARIMFYPSLLLKMIKHWWNPARNPWWNRVDESVIMGALLFPSYVKTLYEKENVRAVVNCCEEFPGAISELTKYQIPQLRLKIIDYCQPTLDDIHHAISFISEHTAAGKTVYIHCKGGKGRSGAVTMCYLMKKYKLNPQEAMKMLSKQRPAASKKLPQYEAVRLFYSSLLGDSSSPSPRLSDKE